MSVVKGELHQVCAISGGRCCSLEYFTTEGLDLENLAMALGGHVLEVRTFPKTYGSVHYDLLGKGIFQIEIYIID